MNIGDFDDLYRYNDWASERLLAAVRALPAEASVRAFEGSFATLRDLLAHVAGADWIWLERFGGASPSAIPDWFRTGDARVLCDQLAEVTARRREFLHGLSEPFLLVELSFRYLDGTPASLPLRDALFHVANHATYHRGQLASMLRALGTAPPATDFTAFRAETRG